MTLDRENFDSDWTALNDSLVNNLPVDVPGLTIRVGRYDSLIQSSGANGTRFITYRGKWLEAVLCYRPKTQQSIFKTT